MLTRHLLPDEVALLVDDEEGFGIAPLRAHVSTCGDCQARVALEREVVELVEHLPYAAPTAGFQDRVMQQVQIFEPWHVAATDTLRRLVPPPGPWRVVAGAGIAGAVCSLSAILLWVALRVDTVLYVTQVGLERAQGALVAAAGSAVSFAFGDAAAAALPLAGTWGTVAALTALLGSVALAGLGLRSLAARRHRGGR
jgi:hypothetical protein